MMRLAFMGDVMLGRLVNEVLGTVPPAYVWGDVLPRLRAADARVLNLECVIADRGRPWPDKTFTFRSDARNVAVLEAASITAVSLANNHSLDYGPDALLECLGLLRGRGIGAAGAGRHIGEATAPALFTIGRATVALVAWTDNMPEWEATPERPGVFYAPADPEDPRFERLLGHVSAAGADLVIVSCHWGGNWGRVPPREHTAAARALIGAGADVVFGHSPHVFRGVEVYRERPILYGCGDFVDDYAVDPVERNDWSFLFLVEMGDRHLARLTMVPTVIRDFQARLAPEPERSQIVERMRTLCAGLGTRAEVRPEGLVIRP